MTGPAAHGRLEKTGIRSVSSALWEVEVPMPDFAVRVRGAKGRSWRSPRRLVAVYLGLWVFALVVFLLMDPTDAMGYALLFHWLLLPIAASVDWGTGPQGWAHVAAASGPGTFVYAGGLSHLPARQYVWPLTRSTCLSGTCFSSGRPSLPWAFSSGDCWAAGDPNLPD